MTTTHQEAFDWVIRIIDSCESSFHFEAAGQLIELFKIKYPNEKQEKELLIDRFHDKIMEKHTP